MRQLIISILAFLFFASRIDAQLFASHKFYPGISTIKGRYYNGSGGGRHWSLAKLDTLGRTIEKESYLKNRLLARYNYAYNFNNDQLYEIATFDFNNPNSRSDTISNCEYKYQADRIVYQRKMHRNTHDSTVMELIKNQGDTLLIYLEKSYYLRPKTNTTEVFERRYTLKYQNDLLVQSEEFDLYDSSKVTTRFEYFPNRMLKRRKLEREPELEGEYSGGPASDDEYYRYKLDKSGRIKVFYRIIGNRTYRIATYKYGKLRNCGKKGLPSIVG